MELKMKKIFILIIIIVLYFIIVENISFRVQKDKDGITKYIKGNVTVDIANGLTPVIYDEDINCWRIINKDEEWFDYNKQKWANAVILKEKDNNDLGRILSIEKDVIAMYVYIPRYSYTINYPYGKSIDGSNASSLIPGAIDIKFINKDIKENGKASYIGNKVEEYRTHPAFTFGDKELNGIWVGKFEMTGNKDNPTILPNNKALTNLNIYSLFNSIKSISNKYNLDNSIYDSHMIKNSEWGAVIYLTQSKYGKYGNNDYTKLNKEVYQNKSLDYVTGMSNGTPSNEENNNQISYDVNEKRKKEIKIKKENTGKNIKYKIIDNDYFIIEDNLFKYSKKENDSNSSISIAFTLEEKGNIDFDWSASTPNVEVEKLEYNITKDEEIIINSYGIGGIKRGIEEDKLKYDHVMHELDEGKYIITFKYKNIFVEYNEVPNSLNGGYIKNLTITTGSEYETKIIKTEENGTGASTTGNIYGIYDMSGGAIEYVMGLYINDNKEFGSTNEINYSGFTTKNKPDSKYYDIYISSDMDNACNNRKCYGIGYGETSWWYEDIATSYAFPTQEFPWVFRGDSSLDSAGAGIFMNYGKEGMALSNFTSRAVLTINN